MSLCQLGKLGSLASDLSLLSLKDVIDDRENTYDDDKGMKRWTYEEAMEKRFSLWLKCQHVNATLSTKLIFRL